MSTSARLASRCHTLLTTASSSSTSWLMTMRPPRWLVRNPRSQVIESASRWLVGSSSSSVSASEKRIRASSTRRRWPPDRVRSGWASTRSGRPRLLQMRAASALGGVPAHRGELVLEPAVAAHRLVPLGVVGRLGHGDLRLGELVACRTSRPRPESTRSLAVMSRSPLRGSCGQVADLAGDLDLAGVRDALPGERGQRGGLAGAVAADQADPVAGLHAEGGVADEDAATGTQLEAGRRDH